MPDYLHDHKDFAGLIKILTEEKGIEPGFVIKTGRFFRSPLED